MGNKVVSIEIGQDRTKICEVDYKKKHPKVYKCLTFSTPSAVIEDGYIRDKRAFAAVLKEKMESAEITNTNVVFSISSTKIANREVMIPLVKEKQIREIIMANASDYFPIDVEQYNITHLVLERINKEEQKQIRLMVLAAPTDLIRTYYELAEMLKVTIKAIDYVGNSSFQVLKGQESENVNLVVQMNDQNTIINLLEHDCLLLQRILPYGIDNVAQAVMSNEIFEAPTYEAAMELLATKEIVNTQFTSMEDNYSTFLAASEEYNKKLLLENAIEDVTSSLRNLTANMNRVIDYFTTKHPEKKISEIQITGNGAEIVNLQHLIQNEIGIKTSVLTKLNTVTVAKQAQTQNPSLTPYISCIGAAIAPLNFAPRELVLKEEKEKTMMFPLLMLGVCIVGAFAIFLSSYLLYRQSVTEKDRLQVKVDEIKDIEDIYDAYNKSEASLANIEKIDGQTKHVSEHMLTFLMELESKTPKGCNVSSFQLGESQLTMQVTATNKELCAKYIQNLKTCEQIDTVTSAGYSEESQAAKVTFTVVCTFK